MRRRPVRRHFSLKAASRFPHQPSPFRWWGPPAAGRFSPRRPAGVSKFDYPQFQYRRSEPGSADPRFGSCSPSVQLGVHGRPAYRVASNLRFDGSIPCRRPLTEPWRATCAAAVAGTGFAGRACAIWRGAPCRRIAGWGRGSRTSSRGEWYDAVAGSRPPWDGISPAASRKGPAQGGERRSPERGWTGSGRFSGRTHRIPGLIRFWGEQCSLK